MTNALVVIRKENNKQDKLLSKENYSILTDIVVYLRSSNLTDYSVEAIRKELRGMALESELRNEKFSNVVGEDYKLFCDELIKNGTQKTLYEKILENLSVFFEVVAFLLFMEIFFTSTITNIITKGNFVMPIKLGFVISTVCVIIFAYAIVWYITKYSFELSNKNQRKYKIAFIITFTAIWTLVLFLRITSYNIILSSVNCLFPLIFFIIGIIAVKLLQTNNINKKIERIK